MLGYEIRASKVFGWLAMVLGSLWAPVVFAQGVSNEGEAKVVLLDCEELTADARAAVEARLAGELIVSEDPAKLNLRCAKTEVSGTIERGEMSLRDWRKRSISLSEDLFDLGIALLEHEAVDSETEAPHADASTTHSDERVIANSSDAASSQLNQENPQPLRVAVALGGAAVYQHWGTQAAGALGPQLEGALFLGRRAGVSVELGSMFALAAPRGYRLWELRGQMTGFMRIFPWLGVGVGPLFSWMKAGGPTDSDGSQTSSFRPGVMAYVEGILPGKQAEAYARFGASALSVRRVIAQDNVEILTVPQVQVLVSLGFRLVAAGERP